MNSLSLYTTAAFISAGMHADIPRLDQARDILATGAFELVESAMAYTEFTAMLYEAGWLVAGEVPGVFDYEVSEEFGKWYVDYIHTVNALPAVSHACDHLIDLAMRFFGRVPCVDQTKGAHDALRGVFSRISRPEQPQV